MVDNTKITFIKIKGSRVQLAIDPDNRVKITLDRKDTGHNQGSKPDKCLE